MWTDNKALFGLIGALSLVASVVVIVLIPMFLILLPKDYFSNPEPYRLPYRHHHPWVKVVVTIVKNLLGALLVLLGLLLLVLPGQGILTMLVGLILADFPGKRSLELQLVKRRGVLAALNWMRSKVGREPFVV